MEVDAYVQARYGRLLEHAVELGAPDGQAAEYVDEVLVANRRKIRRAVDPDPIVRAALARAIAGRTDPGRSAAVAVAVVLVVVAVVGVVALTVRPDPRPVPALTGYDAAQARQALDEAGFDVVARPARGCDPTDLVTGVEPAVGTLLRPGAQVTVRVAVPYDCLEQYVWRSQAWTFVRWARDLAGPPPFATGAGDASAVTTYVDGEPATLDDARGLVAGVTSTRADSPTGLVPLQVDDAVAPASTCGVDRPAGLGERTALRLTLDAGDVDCPLTVDLYRTDGASGGVIDTVVVTTAVTD